MILSLRNLGYVTRFEDELEPSHDDLIRYAFSLLPMDVLLCEELVWDYRDLFISLVQIDPSLGLAAELFGQDLCTHLVDTVMAQLEGPSQTTSTKLALLDMAESVLLARPPSDKSWKLLDQATELISSLLQQDGNLVKSRQYVRWILARVNHEVYGRADGRCFVPPAGTPGLFHDLASGLPFPIYVPCHSEVPILTRPKSEHDPVSFIESALDAARSLQDYETEALCLQALTHFAAEPARFYEQLARLQKDTQQDLQGCLHTYLASYIYCRDQESRTQLRQNIIKLGYIKNLPPVLIWARAMILRAFSLSAEEEMSYFEEAEEAVYTLALPPDCSSFMRAILRRQKPRNPVSRPRSSRRQREYEDLDVDLSTRNNHDSRPKERERERERSLNREDIDHSAPPSKSKQKGRARAKDEDDSGNRVRFVEREENRPGSTIAKDGEEEMHRADLIKLRLEISRARDRRERAEAELEIRRYVELMERKMELRDKVRKEIDLESREELDKLRLDLHLMQENREREMEEDRIIKRQVERSKRDIDTKWDRKEDQSGRMSLSDQEFYLRNSKTRRRRSREPSRRSSKRNPVQIDSTDTGSYSDSGSDADTEAGDEAVQAPRTEANNKNAEDQSDEEISIPGPERKVSPEPSSKPTNAPESSYNEHRDEIATNGQGDEPPIRKQLNRAPTVEEVD